MPRREVLIVEHVSKSFGGIRALVDVSFKLYEGESIAIIGPNGAGKTTLFNVINGIYQPDSGRIIFEGVDVTKLPPHKRAQMGLSRAFQIPRPFPYLTVFDNVMVSALFSPKKLGVDQARTEALSTLELVGLIRKKDELAANLTAPEKKLLELARALAKQPKVLLLDEIVAGMPPAEVDRIMKLVKEVADRKGISSVAFVEHVIRAVQHVDRVLFLYQGRILAEGPPREVLANELVRRVYLGEVV
ncbi:ABC transporter ATP-binding protein [Thermogladius sp. KZ2Tp1]|uniref:ABC transporter ATP-binding protein n=1 Tax=Thermogladius sp. KZ2Tp1 TaxID=3136289 RepID=UPI003DAA148F